MYLGVTLGELHQLSVVFYKQKLVASELLQGCYYHNSFEGFN